LLSLFLFLLSFPHSFYTGKDISVMKQWLESLPLDNYALLKHTLWLLYDVSLHREINQMGSDNLAKVFGYD
jgi:hypothetical protein